MGTPWPASTVLGFANVELQAADDDPTQASKLRWCAMVPERRGRSLTGGASGAQLERPLGL